METPNNLGENMQIKVYTKNADVVTRRIADELFLVPIKGNIADMQRIFTLNPVAEFIWQQIDMKNLKEIRDGIVDQFDIEKERAEADIQEFIMELLKANLISE
jgi:hypothetical protein